MNNKNLYFQIHKNYEFCNIGITYVKKQFRETITAYEILLLEDSVIKEFNSENNVEIPKILFTTLDEILRSQQGSIFSKI